MDAPDRAVFLIQLVASLAPVAAYFLFLGLVNSRAQPCLISARSDFVALTVVFGPLLIWPAPALLSYGVAGLVAVTVGFGVAFGLFWRLLPAGDAGWVVYNISTNRLHRLVGASFDALGWEWRRVENRYELPGRSLVMSVSGYAFLRNATIQTESLAGGVDGAGLARFRSQLDAQLRAQELLPSLSGSCMLLLGVGVLIVPLWMMSRHMDVIVELMQRLFVA